MLTDLCIWTEALELARRATDEELMRWLSEELVGSHVELFWRRHRALDLYRVAHRLGIQLRFGPYRWKDGPAQMLRVLRRETESFPSMLSTQGCRT